MPEGLSAAEVGKEIAEHGEHHAEEAGGERHDRVISILEAVVLSFVAVLAAYSGYAAAKWGTESSISLAKASTLRSKASRADLEATAVRTADSASFNAWFTAFLAHDVAAEHLAERRLRPGYRVAFNAWLATDPIHNPNAPPGPAYMPQYVIPQETAGKLYDAKADQAFSNAETAGGNSDKYVRDTIFLATVLFLVGISGHFRIVQARYALVGIGVALLAFSIIQLAALPAPP